MTSNLGTEALRRQPFGFRTDGRDQDLDEQGLRDSVNDALKRGFRPEFLNRIDDIIVFNTLTKEQIHQIVDMIVAEV